MKIYTNNGFTLVEIVIALSLIGLFISIPVLAYGTYMKKSRDIKRKNDINQIQAALSHYKVNYGTFPSASEGLQILVDRNYMPTLPKDPKSALPYSYVPSSNNLEYSLTADLEDVAGFYLANAFGTQVVVGSPSPSIPIPTNTAIPLFTPLPSATFTPTKTPTPSLTPSITLTPTASLTPTPTPIGNIYYVSTTGSDSNSGTFTSPFRTVLKGITTLRAGDLLYIRGGTYVERIQNPTQYAGTSALPITVKAYPGERPIIQGLLWLNGSTYWTFDGLNITWDDATGQASEHMVKLTGGTNWIFTNGEIWNAKSYAGLLISGNTSNWVVSYTWVHDTDDCQVHCSGSSYPHTVNQDHLVYVDNTTNGTFDHMLLTNSPNGRGIKLGPPSGVGGPSFITIKYSTFDNNLGPANIQVSGEAHDNVIFRNILEKPKSSSTYNITQNLSGPAAGNNRAYDNIGWLSKGVVQSDPTLLIDGGGNLSFDPKFDVTYHPLEPSAQSYGRFAP